MQTILRDLIVWMISFLSISCSLLLVVHLVRRAMTPPAPAKVEQTASAPK